MVIRFADYVLDTEARQLFQGGHEIHLAPKAFELLSLLIVARPRAFDKAELQQKVWPDTFVAEANLPVLIGQIREALGDAARTPKFIRTVHRFGYAFCGTAAELQTRGAPATSEHSQCWIATRTRRMPLVRGENTVGRDPTATVWLDRPSVSRHHARIIVLDDHATIEDLGSKNGTYVRGRPIVTAERLCDCDRIVIGSINLIFRRPSGASSTKTGIIRRCRPRARSQAVEATAGEPRAKADAARDKTIDRRPIALALTIVFMAASRTCAPPWRIGWAARTGRVGTAVILA